jgi:hypothetical protein
MKRSAVSFQLVPVANGPYDFRLELSGMDWLKAES